MRASERPIGELGRLAQGETISPTFVAALVQCRYTAAIGEEHSASEYFRWWRPDFFISIIIEQPAAAFRSERNAHLGVQGFDLKRFEQAQQRRLNKRKLIVMAIWSQYYSKGVHSSSISCTSPAVAR